MLLLYIIILLLGGFGCRIKISDYWADYIDREQCNAIKGVFILTVFIRHIVPYIITSGYEMTSFLDRYGMLIDSYLGQLIVAMFLFYSGYGVMESIKRKGKEYVSTFPRRRILTTLLNFDMAILFFLFLNWSCGIHYSFNDVLMSFTGWTAIGNSNWYIFVILCCYVFSFLAFRWVEISSDRRVQLGGCIIAIQSFILLLILWNTKNFSCWYNTVFCYSAGTFFSIYRQRFEKVVSQNYRIITLCILLAFVFLFFVPYDIAGIRYNIVSIAFSLLVVLLSMKVKIGNPVLLWLGKMLFPLYIYQRIPMIFFSTVFDGVLPAEYPFAYIFICLTMTFSIAYFYKYIEIKIK